MHSHQAVGDPALSSLMVFAVFELMPLPSTVSAYTVFILVVGTIVLAIVLAIIWPDTVIAPIPSMPIASAVVASPAVATSPTVVVLAIAVIVLAVAVIVTMSIVTILVALIAVVITAGFSNQCISLPANTECPLVLS